MFLISESGHKYILAFKVLLTCVIQNIICSPFWKKDKRDLDLEQHILLLRENGALCTLGRMELRTALLRPKGSRISHTQILSRFSDSHRTRIS